MFYIINRVKLTTILTCFLSASLLLYAFNLHANSPVKSIDAKGNVTYSDKPVKGAEQVTKIPIQSGPTESEIDAARQQARKNIQAAEEIDASKAANKKQQNAKHHASKKDSVITPDAIIMAPPISPLYRNKPNPPVNNLPSKKPPERPGINPPAIPSHPIARPATKLGR